MRTQVPTGAGQRVQEPTQTPADTGLPAKAPAPFNGKSFQKATLQQLSNRAQEAHSETHLRPHTEINSKEATSLSVKAKFGKVLEETQEKTYLPWGLTKIV